MTLEAVLVAISLAIVGFSLGKHMTSKEAIFRSRPLEQKVAAYKELFAAFLQADSALITACTDETDGQMPDETKELVWASLNTVGRIFASARFMFPQTIVDVMEEYCGGHLGMSWGERLDELRRVKDTVYLMARKDIGADSSSR